MGVHGNPHVAIIGAGVAGLSAAACLAEAGCTVTVIERGTIASGSSGLSVGVYSEGTYVDPLNIAMRRYAIAELRTMRDSHGLSLNEIGFLRLARDENVLRGYREGLRRHREAGISDTSVIERDELSKLVPAMNCGDFIGALWAPRDGYLDGHELAGIYASRAKAAGAQLMFRSALNSASHISAKGHRLETSNSVFRADFVVNAAGAWADKVGEILGAPIEIIPQRHQVCVVNTREAFGFTLPEVMDNVPGSGEEGLWFRQEKSNQFLAGLHSNDVIAEARREDPDHYDRAIDDEYLERLVQMLLYRLPGFDMSYHSGWAGLYPLTPDGSFVLGPAPERPTVIHACGTGGVGVNLSPAIGRVVADWILKGRPSIAGTEALAPRRSEPYAHVGRENSAS